MTPYIVHYSSWKSFVDFTDQLVAKHETFALKHFCFDNTALKMAGHDPGSSLKEFL